MTAAPDDHEGVTFGDDVKSPRVHVRAGRSLRTEAAAAVARADRGSPSAEPLNSQSGPLSDHEVLLFDLFGFAVAPTPVICQAWRCSAGRITQSHPSWTGTRFVTTTLWPSQRRCSDQNSARPSDMLKDCQSRITSPLRLVRSSPSSKVTLSCCVRKLPTAPSRSCGRCCAPTTPSADSSAPPPNSPTKTHYDPHSSPLWTRFAARSATRPLFPPDHPPGHVPTAWLHILAALINPRSLGRSNPREAKRSLTYPR